MTEQLDQKLRTRLQVSLFVVFLAIFAATSVLTLLALFGNFGALSPEQKDLLVKATLLEVAAGVIAFFYAIFGLRNKSQAAAETPSEPRAIAPPRIDVTAQSLNSAETRGIFAQILMNIADSSAHPTIQSLVPENAALETQALSVRKVQASALAMLFRDMGLIVIDAKGQIQLVSDLAGCFIRSIAIHLEENLDFIGGMSE